MFHLGRPDVFSGGDLGLRNGLRIAHDLDEVPSPEEAIAIVRALAPLPHARLDLSVGSGSAE